MWKPNHKMGWILSALFISQNKVELGSTQPSRHMLSPQTPVSQRIRAPFVSPPAFHFPPAISLSTDKWNSQKPFRPNIWMHDRCVDVCVCVCVCVYIITRKRRRSKHFSLICTCRVKPGSQCSARGCVALCCVIVNRLRLTQATQRIATQG